MVEISSCQKCWRNSDIKKLHDVVGLNYFQNHKKIRTLSRVDSEGNYVNAVLKKSTSDDIKDEIDEPSVFKVDHRLNSIFQMCLEPGLGDHPSLTSPKNFVVQYFTVSQNHPVKSCHRTQCPFAGRGLRTKEIRQQPICSKLSLCKRSQIATQDQFSHCANPPDEILNAPAELGPCTSSLKKSDDSNQDDNIPCIGLRKGCSSTFSCTSRISDVKSLMRKKRHTLQQTDPEQSWQTRCSNFIINLPLTLSDKLFGPRTTCEALIDEKRTIFNDSRINSSKPVPDNTSKPSPRDQDNKKLVKSRVSSLVDRGCHKNIGTDRVFLEKANQVDPCYLTTTQSVPESIPCGISSRKLEESTITCKKVTSKCGKSCEDSSSRLKMCANHLEGVRSRGSELNDPWLKCGVKNKASSLISKVKKRRKTSLRFSNWPAILSKKIFGPRSNEKVLRFCLVDNKVSHAKATDGVTDNTEIISKMSKPSSAKNRRLLLKKYTISQTPEAMEETLCFDILTGKQLTETKTKIENQFCLKRTIENKHKLETIRERNEVLTKCLETNGSYSSKRCIKSKGNVCNELSSRRTKQFEKKTSTEQIFLSSLIMKLLNRNRDYNYNTCNEKKSHRSTASRQNREKKDERERKCAFKQRANTVSRKYAATSIHKRKNKSVKCQRYGEKHSKKKETGSCSLEHNVLCPDHRADNFSNTSGEDQTRRKYSSDFSNGKEDISKPDNTRTHLFEDSLEGVKEFCCVNKRLKNESIDEEEYQDCDSCGSSRVRKGLVKSGALQMTAESCRREPREFCCATLHRRNRKEKSDLREKYCKRIISREKFAYKARSRNEIEYNDLRLASRERRDCEMISPQRYITEERFCTRRHRDVSATKNGIENCGNIDSILTPMERKSRKRCHREKFPKTRVCDRLLIVKENQISDPTKNRVFLITNENICLKMFHDRETCTDDFLESVYCQSSKNAGERIPYQKLSCKQTTLGVDMESVKNCAPSSSKTDQNSITHVIQSPNSQGSSQDSVWFSPQSKSPEGGHLLEENGNGSMQKPPENAMRIRVECEECLGSLSEDDACRVYPGGISECEDILETKQDCGKAFESLRQEVCGEDRNTVCGGETCLYKTLIKSETKEAQEILKEDEFCQRQSIPVESSSKVNHCSSSLATSKFCSPEETHNFTNESNDKYESSSDNSQLSKASSRKIEQPDGVNLEMNISEKRNSWIKSPEKDLAVTRPESRNIINSFYSQKKSTLASRCELARNNVHVKVKKGKVQQDGSVSEKSITKARKPFQRIENFRQPGCTANPVIKDVKGKKRDVVEKENSIVNKNTRYTQGESVFDGISKDYFIQNMHIDDLSLGNDSIAILTPDYALSIQKIKERNSLNPKLRTPASKIPKKSKPLIKNITSEEVSTFTTKALENSIVNVKESSRKNWLKKGNIRTDYSEKIDAKVRAKEAGIISECADNESSDRHCTRSIDTYDSKGSEGQKEFKAPAYISDKENIKPRTLRMEMSSVKEQKIPYDFIGKGASWNVKERESSETYSKSSNLWRNCEQREDDRSRNSSAVKESKENKQTFKENQSESETRNKKNEKDKKSTPLKLLSQIDSKIDSRTSTQRSVTMNADLFTSALMDGKNNIKSYRDLQSVGKKTSNSNRISASKDEGLRKSGTPTAESKSKVLKSYKSSKTNVKSTSEKIKIHKKSKYSKENIEIAKKITDEDKADNISSKISSPSVHMGNSNEELTENSGHNKVDVTEDSLSIEVNNVEPSRSTVYKNNGNSERDLKLRSSSPRNSKEVERLKKQHSLANKSNIKKNSIADRNFEKRCRSRIVESETLPKNISSEKSSAYSTSRVSNHKRLSCEFGISPYHTKNRTQTLASVRSSDSNKKTKQEIEERHALPPGSPSSKSSKDKNELKSNHVHERTKNIVNMQKQGIPHSKMREKKSKELITEIENSLVPEVKCEKSTDAECSGTDSNKLCKVLKNPNVEENKQIEQNYDVPDKLTTFFTPERIINNSSPDRNFSLTDDLKRFFDQGQEFFNSKRKKNSDETTLYSVGRQELTPDGGCESNESEVYCTETTKFCKNVDYEKLKNPLKICDDDQASNNSISSLQKAYSTLKTIILNKTKNIQKSFTNTKQTKETQIYTTILDEQSHGRQHQTSQKCKLI